MHPAASLVLDHARRHHQLLVPLLFSVLAATAHVHGPVQHQLLVTSVSLAAISLPALLWTGFTTLDAAKRRPCWLAAGFLSLSQICDRAACDKEGIWATKGLLPLLVVLLSEHDVLAKHLALPTQAPSDGVPATEQRLHTPSFRLVAVLTLSASVILSTRFTASPTSALGISSVIFAATGLVLFGDVLKSLSNHGHDDKPRLVSTNGAFSSQKSAGGATWERQLVALRDVAIVMAVVCGIAAYLTEPRISSSVVSWVPVYRFGGGHVSSVYQYSAVQLLLLLLLINSVANVLMFLMVVRSGVLHTSCLYLFAHICARLRLGVSFSGVWFTLIYGSSALILLHSGSSSSSLLDIRSSLRFRRGLFGVTALSFGLVLFQHISTTRHSISSTTATSLYTSPPTITYGPLSMDLGRGHPAAQLIDSGEKAFQQLLDKQSKTLADAVTEYRRRNGIAPPPHFDKWYEFASRNGVVLIDEFDTITQTLLPYWSLKPATIRERIRNALGHEDSALVGIMIRDGSVVKAEGGPEWQQEATVGMMEKFVQYLPDMDLGFNIHDEPRVVVPNDHLAAMVAKALEVLPVLAKQHLPKNGFSPRPSDMNDGHRIEEVSTTRFNRFAHQQTWTHSRLSCPADSQAQKFESQVPDNLTAYAAGPLNYIVNQTAFTDICNSPSLSSTYGFFERPNAFNVVYELTPIFSSSKISSFQDILFPSPWYWVGKVGYDESHDTTWDNKTNSLYWRGSTTGGFSRKGGWRRQHRQRIVRRINALDKANISVPADGPSHPMHKLEEIDRTLYNSFIDVKFSHIGQCDPGDCDAQREFFALAEHTDGQDAWYYKHLLDIDGNAFSGRFYSFLKSRSLTYKMAVFREWHQEWLVPWVHYVPLSLIGDEHLDLVRWFTGADVRTGNIGEEDTKNGDDKGGNGDSLGELRARQIAERSREWAGKALRNVDLEAWFFRLLLEYGRIIDDDRENIGYPGP